MTSTNQTVVGTIGSNDLNIYLHDIFGPDSGGDDGDDLPSLIGELFPQEETNDMSFTTLS